MKFRPVAPLVSLLGFILLLARPGPLRAQSADEILRTAAERYRQRVADVDDYTLVQEVNGVRRVSFYRKKMVDGRPVFVPPSPVELALQGTGMGTNQLKATLVAALTQAGLQSLSSQLQDATSEQTGRLVASFGQRLAAGGGGSPGDALKTAGTDAAKHALVDAAVDAGLQALASGLGGATGAEVGIVVQALRKSDGFGDALGNLARALPRMAGAAMPGAGGLGGGPGAGSPSGSAVGQSPTASSQTRMLSAVATAGVGALVGMGARKVAGAFSGGDDTSHDTFGMLLGIADRFDVKGTEDVDGHPTWVLVADDLEGVELGGDDFSPSSVRLHMDRKDYVVRQIDMQGKMDMDGRQQDVTVQVRMDDYRDVQGMLQPFHTTMSFQGAGQAMSDEDRAKLAQAQEQMKKMQEQLSKMPPAQRQMVEQQLKAMGGVSGLQAQMQQMGGGDGMTMETVVKEIRVNQGMPDDLTGSSPVGAPGG